VPEPEQQRVLDKIKQLYHEGVCVNAIAVRLNADENDRRVIALNKRHQQKYADAQFDFTMVKRILIQNGLLNAPAPGLAKKSVQARIESHRK
jgi:hypothetical protein